MKRIKLGGFNLPSGLFIKPYHIEVYDGNLYEMPEINRVNFENQMYASEFVPTDLDSLLNLSTRLSNALKDNTSELQNICNNLLSGFLQKIETFTCKNHAFFCLIKGVNNFDEETAKQKMKTLQEHGLNSLNTDSICEDVKKKYIRNYDQTFQAYTKMERLIKKS